MLFIRRLKFLILLFHTVGSMVSITVALNITPYSPSVSTKSTILTVGSFFNGGCGALLSSFFSLNEFDFDDLEPERDENIF